MFFPIAVAAAWLLVCPALAVTFTQPIMMETSEGVTIDSTGSQVAIGTSANGDSEGAAVGYEANGASDGVAIGVIANGYFGGVAVGADANGSHTGVALGYSANGYSLGAALGYYADGGGRSAAFGYSANGIIHGAAMGYYANGSQEGAALGLRSNGSTNGVAIGYHANGYHVGASVGYKASSYHRGAAVGAFANGQDYGAALGSDANGDYYGTAAGSYANAYCCGVALGRDANTGDGNSTNPRIAIGYSVNNDVNDSCRIRGTLYIDGCGAADANIKYRQAFGSGSWSTKSFVIDHPLDPEHKVLRHACVESPEVLNVYRGTVVLDSKGEAVVQLPEYFAALNTNPHYTLTPVGAPMPEVHVKEEVRGNTFVVAGGVSGGKVCWEVTGARDDAAMRAHPFVAEERKAVPGLVYGAR
jgi:hypothetical protein